MAESLVWRKSSRSNGSGGECVEVAQAAPLVAVRDSKAPHAGMLRLADSDFRALLTHVRD